MRRLFHSLTALGVAERTIIATALAYIVVVYCGSRLETYPGASLMDQAAYIAPIVTICFATIGVGLLAFRLEYSRVQFFGSGFLVFFWVLGAAHLRVRFFTRSYAVVPAPSLATMPGVRSCRWLNLDDAVARSVRLRRHRVDQLDAKYEANKRATEWLEERLGELRRAVQTADDQVATYRRDKGLLGSPEGAVSSQTLNDLNASYTKARARRIEREARLVALRRASLNPSELANIAEVTNNVTLGGLRMQEIELGRRVAELSEKLGENHPRLIQARNELGAVRGRFANETRSIAVAIQAELDAARSEEEQLKVQVDRASSTSGESSQYEAELKQLEREASPAAPSTKVSSIASRNCASSRISSGRMHACWPMPGLLFHRPFRSISRP